MSLNAIGQNINVNNANLVITDQAKKIRSPKYEFNSGATLVSDTSNITASTNIVTPFVFSNAKHMVALTDAAAGTYGSQSANVAQIPQIVVDASGRITSIETIDLDISSHSGTSNIEVGTAGQLSFYKDSTTIGGSTGIVFNETDSSLVLGGDLRVAGDLEIMGNTILTNNFVTDDRVVSIGRNAPDNSTLALHMQRPSGNVAMTFVSGELGPDGSNTLVFSFTNGSANDFQLAPDLTKELPVKIIGNLEVSNTIVANTFIGDGSQLTGISTASTLQEITELGNTTNITSFFTNTDVSLVASGNVEANAIVTTNVLFDSNLGLNSVQSLNLQDICESGNVYTGAITAAKFIGDGSLLTGINGSSVTAEQISNAIVGSDLTLGDVTANAFIGDGSLLTGIQHLSNAEVKSIIEGDSLTLPNLLVSNGVVIDGPTALKQVHVDGGINIEGELNMDNIPLYTDNVNPAYMVVWADGKLYKTDVQYLAP